MSENVVIILLAILCVILLLACLLIVVFRDTSESADNALEDAGEAVEMARKFNQEQNALNNEAMRFLKAEDDYLGRPPLAVRMAGYRAATPEGR